MRNLLARAALLGLLVIAGGQGAIAAPGEPPKARCQASAVEYDYSRDSRVTPQGNEGYARYAARAHRAECLKPWTVLVYMAADNDLAPYAYWDLYEMEAGFRSGRKFAGSTDRADLIVQLDTPGTGDLRRIHVFQTTDAYDPRLNKSYFSGQNASFVRSPVALFVPDRGESEARKLESFLEWGIREYPAQNYMVVVWGHGQGWAAARPPAQEALFNGVLMSKDDLIPWRDADREADPSPFAGRKFGGIAFNASTGGFLDIPSLRRVLRTVSDEALGGRPIDVYAADACLMQMVEVATEVSESARFIVGSTEVEDYLGLPYRRMMYELNLGRFAGYRMEGDEGYSLARMLPPIFRASMEPNGLHGRNSPEAIRTVTMSSLSSQELGGLLLPAATRLGAAIERFMAEDPLRSIDLEFILQNAPGFQGGAQEFGAFLTLLEELLKKEVAARGDSFAIRELEAAVIETHAAIDRTVLSYALGTRYTDSQERLYLMGIRALSLWLPSSERDYQDRIDEFSSSRFYQMTGWGRWLSHLFGVRGQ